jgi:uridine phosphorylase
LPIRRSLTIIRIGTSGSIQPDIEINRFCLSTHALGLDNLLHFYKDAPTVFDKEMTEAFLKHAAWPEQLSKPYIVKGSERLVEKLRPFTIPGITVTAPGFYGPQGRFLRLLLSDPDMIHKLQTFNYNGHRITNFEMETSALYGLGSLMGHEMVTVCALIANRATGTYSGDHKPFMGELITRVLETITK